MANPVIKFDSKKLRNTINNSAFSQTQLSLYLHQSDNYISGALNAGRMPQQKYIAVCKLMQIEPEDYLLHPERQPETPEGGIPGSDTSAEKLRDIDVTIIELIAQQKQTNKYLQEFQQGLAQMAKAQIEALETLKNAKVEAHADATRIYNHIKFQKG